MTTIFGLYEFEMDVSHLDDKMEIGTSPYPQVDDIDFEFEQIRQSSVDRSMVDETEDNSNDVDLMQAEANNTYNDDDMLDEDTLQPLLDDDNTLGDLKMDAYSSNNIPDQDEEILYDDEETGFAGLTGQSDHENQTVDTLIPKAMEDNYFQVDNSDNNGNRENRENINDHTNVDEETTNPDNQYLEEELNNREAQDPEPNSLESLPSKTEVVDFAASHEVSQFDKQTDVQQQHVTQLENNPTLQDQSPEDQYKGDADDSDRHEEDQQHIQDGDVNNDPNVQPGNDNESVGSLHPITIVYLGQEMSLFPPMVDDSSATFFVSETSLAYEPMEKLLASFRENLGETLGHEDELVLDIPALGLHICEDSKYASQITLMQIIDVYLQLSQNENIENIDPLFCSLSSRVCLASQYTYLTSSASEGKTFSEIAADYVESPEHEVDSFQDGANESQPHEVEASVDVSLHRSENVPKSTDIQADKDTGDHTADETEHESASISNIAQTAPESVSQDGEEQEEQDHDAADATRTEPFNLPEQSEQSDSLVSHPPQDQVISVETADTKGHNDNFDHRNTTNEDNDNASDSSHTVEGEADDELVEQSFHVQEDTTENALELPNDNQDDLGQYETLDFENELSNGNEAVYAENHFEDQEGSFNAPKSGIVNGDADSNEEKQAHQFSIDEAEYDDLGLDNLIETQDGGDENGEDPAELDFLQTEDVVDVPITPSKQNGSKRKAPIEEDELDFLDLSTPEPKRTRAS